MQPGANDRSVTVEVFPAGHGDAVLVRCRCGTKATNILVDGGVGATYERFLKRRLVELAAAGEHLALVVVTHIDADHIEGVISLLEENGRSDAPKIISIKDIWHNGYRHLDLAGRQPTEVEKQKVFAASRTRGQSTNEANANASGDNVSVKQGSTLSGLILKHGYRWNGAFSDSAVSNIQTTAGQLGKVELDLGVQIRILSPTRDRLLELGYIWRRELLKMGVSHEAVDCLDFAEAFEANLVEVSTQEEAENVGTGSASISSSDDLELPPALAFIEDTSVTNGSSIAFELEFFGTRLFFLGDSYPSTIATALRLRSQEVSIPIACDLVKVSHHGSRRSTSSDLLSLIRSRIFLVQTNGKLHGHPDLEALIRIASAQSGTEIVFNYATPAAERIGLDDAKARYRHTTRVLPTDRATSLDFQCSEVATPSS